jgi:hypothetical protein
MAPGFYVDALAQEAQTKLLATGDLDGALLVAARDRSWRPFATRLTGVAARSLAAIAADSARPVELRLAALGALSNNGDLLDDEAAVRDTLKLLADPLAVIRAAAVEPVAHTNGQRAALDARFTVETDRDVLFALASTFPNGIHAVASGSGIVSRATIAADNVLLVEMRCTRKDVALDKLQVVATQHGRAVTVPRLRTSYGCGFLSGGSSAVTPDELTPGHYDLALDGKDGKPHLPLGVLTSDTNGTYTFTPAR